MPRNKLFNPHNNLKRFAPFLIGVGCLIDFINKFYISGKLGIVIQSDMEYYEPYGKVGYK